MSQVRNPVAEPPYVTLSAEKAGDSLLSVDASLVRALYIEHGALLFRGFAWDVEVFRAVTDRFCSNYVWNDSGGRKIITADRRIQTVNLGVAPFPLHPELARLPWRPDVAWFGCVVAPREGGETLVCDGIRIVEGLADGLRRELGHRRLLYKREMGPGELEFWFGLAEPNDQMLAHPREGCPFKYSREAGKIFGSFTYPVLHKPMFSEKRAFANFLLFARFGMRVYDFPLFEDGSQIPDEICNEIKKVGDRLSTRVAWQKDDLLMIDNTRFMHGRNAIINADERLILTQFGYLNFAKVSDEEPVDPIWRRPHSGS
jgi:alpha-ketoglutarate-dependent taurine dioxygenase